MTGASYRQLIWWTDKGHARPEPRVGIGQGYPLRWSAREVAILTDMAELVRAGLSLRAARELAEAAAEGRADIGDVLNVLGALAPSVAG